MRDEDVFLRESTHGGRACWPQRFDAAGRVLHLVNHADHRATPALGHAAEPGARHRGAGRSAWTASNDVLVVYLTSHGASNFQLAAAHWPLQVDAAEPRRAAARARRRRHPPPRDRRLGLLLRRLGRPAGQRHHAGDDGGRRRPHLLRLRPPSELTFFGRALFDEQLRKTHSFEQAFAAAVPVIRQRESEAGKADGFSNPQISVGEKIRPVLRGAGSSGWTLRCRDP